MDVGASDFSFVIRTRNEQEWIGHAIQSVLDHFGDRTPIVVVDNGSTDDTLEIVSLFNKRFYDLTIHQIEDKRYTPGKALNDGISKTPTGKNRIVGILSAHCQIVKMDRHKVGQLLFGRDDCFAVMGRQVPIFRGKKINPRYIWENFLHTEDTHNPQEEFQDNWRYFFHNAFSFVRRDCWEETPFDEDLSGKEDRYWAQKLIEKKGMHFWFTPTLVCHHHWTANGATWKGMG